MNEAPVSVPQVTEANEKEGSDTPPVTLYGPQGDERREAARLLRDADIGFAEVDTANDGPLVADFGGLTFEGVSGVRDLSAALRAMDEAFERAAQKPWPLAGR
jgi:hypothetical protein